MALNLILSEYNYWLYSFNNLKDPFILEVSVSISTRQGLKISVSKINKKWYRPSLCWLFHWNVSLSKEPIDKIK